jgi:hypothetical protein
MGYCVGGDGRNQRRRSAMAQPQDVQGGPVILGISTLRSRGSKPDALATVAQGGSYFGREDVTRVANAAYAKYINFNQVLQCNPASHHPLNLAWGGLTGGHGPSSTLAPPSLAWRATRMRSLRSCSGSSTPPRTRCAPRRPTVGTSTSHPSASFQ